MIHTQKKKKPKDNKESPKFQGIPRKCFLKSELMQEENTTNKKTPPLNEKS